MQFNFIVTLFYHYFKLCLVKYNSCVNNKITILQQLFIVFLYKNNLITITF